MTINLNRKKKAPTRTPFGTATPLDGRIGFYAAVTELHPENNTVHLVTDTGIELMNIKVASPEWVTYGKDKKPKLTGKRHLPPVGTYVFCLSPTGKYEESFVLCSLFSDSTIHADYMEKGDEAAVKRTGTKSTENKRIINRSLMKKVWSLYGLEGRQIEQAEKDAKAVAEMTENKNVNTESEWGKVYNAPPYSTPLDSAKFLLKKKDGVVKNVFKGTNKTNRKNFAVGLCWGDERMGLRKIIEKHIIKQSDFENLKDAMKAIQDVLENGKEKEFPTKIQCDNGKYRVVLAKTDEGHLVLTSFDKSKSDEEKIRPESEQESKRKELNLLVPNSFTQEGTPLPTTASDSSIPQSEEMSRENRSQAMMGNQNAKKPFSFSSDDFSEKTKDYIKKLGKRVYGGLTVNDIYIKNQIKDITARFNYDIKTGNMLTDDEIEKYVINKPLKKDRLESMLKESIWNDAYQKLLNDHKKEELENGTDNTGTEQNGVPDSLENLRAGRGEAAGDKNVLGAENGDNGGEPLLLPDQLGGRPANADGDDVGAGRGRITKGQARKIREQCREILKKPDSEITEADKAVLRQYVGAGGTDEEGASNSGVLYEFYTPRNVINKVWEIVDKYNPKQNKSVIEPSSGIGRFAEGRSEKFTMFELEEDSARIAHILHPDAEIVQGAFQENFLKNKKGRFTKDFEKFDVAVGNPPYGAYTGKYKGMGEGKEFKRYEGYFMSKTLDTLKDGGIMAMVVPSGFMDGKSTYGKDLEKIVGKAELLEAWRLPNGTFESTDVGTDIVVFRKGKGTTVDALTSYFEKNPDHIAGEVSTRIGRFGEETYIKPKDGQTFESAVASIDVGKTEFKAQVEEIASEIKVEGTKPEAKPVTSKTIYGDTVKTDKGVGVVIGYVKKNRKTAGVVVNVNGKSEEILFTDEQQEHRNRSEAMKGNKNAEGEHNYPISPKAHILDAAEFNAKYGKSIDPRDLPVWKVTDKFGNIDMTKLSAEDKKYVETSGKFVKDGGVYTNPVNYASGNIRQKLKNLDPEDPQYEMKKSLLEAVCPAEKKLGQFTLSPITDWAREYKTKDGVDLISGFYEWAGQGGSGDSPITREEIPPELSWFDIRAFIRKKPLKLDRGEVNTDDQKEKERYRERKKQLRRDTAIKLFNRYLQEGLSPEDQKDLTEAWNEKSNSIVNPDYTKIPIFVDGMCTHKGEKEFNLLPQQMKGISMLVNKGTGLLAYDVGVGKTACGIVATVNQIQIGRSKKPLIAVPKSVYTNWIDSIHKLFPNIKVNELGNLGKDYWQEGMTIEDGTISVCTYEGLENIGFNKDEEREINEDVEFSAFQAGEGDSKRAAAGKKEKGEEFAGAAMKTRDEGVQFSDLGFDHITVDEVHNFRNLFKMPRHINKKGSDDAKGESNEFDGLGGGGDPSNRAKKLFAITQLIQRHNDGRNTFLLSATPFQNSPTEIYSILSYMARDKLKEMGYYSLEQFVSNFCKVTREYTVKANKVTEAPTVKSFENVGELQNLLTAYMDKVDGEEAGVVRPYKRMHAPELELTDLQKAIMDECSNYIEQQEKLPKKERDNGYIFRAMNAMKNCALSPALVDSDFVPSGYTVPSPNEAVETSPKLKFVCDSIISQWKQNSQNGQIMYMPLGLNILPQVKNYLVKNGMPKEAIEIIKATSSEKEMDKRDEIFKEFNDVNGKCKVIIGTGTIKEGCNLQGNTTTIYCTQLDWNPTDVQQLWGRGWRQGNKQGIVHCVTPLMHDSLDPMIFSKHDDKTSRSNDLYSYKGDAMNSNDVNAEELKFSLIKDPKKRADLQVMEFTEKNKSDQKMYGQLIDVLHKQIDIAFKSDKDLHTEAGVGMPWSWEGSEKTEQGIKQNLEDIKEWEQKLKDFQKEWKGKEDSFKREDYEPPKNSRGEEMWVSRYDTSVKDVVEKFKDTIETLKNDSETKKSYLRMFNKKLKKLEGSRESCKKYLASKGMNSQADCEAKIQNYLQLMDVARDNVSKAKDMREQFYQEAVAYNEANKKNIPSVDELVKQNVDSIMGDLHLMDDEFKAKIKSENDARFGRDVNKSLPWCYFKKDADGKAKFYIKKSVIANIR